MKPRYRYSKPSLITPNRLGQASYSQSPRSYLGDRRHLHPDERKLALSRRGHRSILSSRRKLGMSPTTTDVVVTALLGAICRRPPKNRVVIHSDQGSQFTSDTWIRFCLDHDLELWRQMLGNTAYLPADIASLDPTLKAFWHSAGKCSALYFAFAFSSNIGASYFA
jgi:putative transposase